LRLSRATFIVWGKPRVFSNFSRIFPIMPTLKPNPNFRAIASWIRDEGDYALIRIQAVRVYDVEICWTPLRFARLAEAIGISHGWLGFDDYAGDFLNLGRTLFDLPMYIPKGQSLPVAGFVESDLQNIEYHTFNQNYYLAGSRHLPAVHINTGIDFWHLSIYLQLALDVVVKYRRYSRPARPSVPSHYTRRIFPQNFACDFPDRNLYSPFGGLNAFGRYEQSGGIQYFAYVDSSYLWDGVDFTEEMQGGHFLFGGGEPPGIRTDTMGRLYYWGSTDPLYAEKFPYKSIEPIPGASKSLNVERGYLSVSGDHIVSKSPDYPVFGWSQPGEGGEPPPPIDPPVRKIFIIAPIINSGVALLFGERLYGKNIDGSWRIGNGGEKIE